MDFVFKIMDLSGSHVVSVHTKSVGSDYTGIIAQVKADLAQTSGVGIVFCLRKADTEKLCGAIQVALQDKGVCDYYHSKRKKSELDDVKRRWEASQLRG